MDDENNNVDVAIEWLSLDAQRCKSKLKRSHIEDVALSLKLSISEQVDLYEALTQRDLIEDSYPESLGEFDSEDDLTNLSSDIEDNGNSDFFNKKFLLHEILSAEEEKKLGRKIALGKEANINSPFKEEVVIAKEADDARYKFTTHNLRLTWRCAKFYADNSDIDVDDLFQEGVIGLMQAIEKFNYQLGFKFSTYATWWIRQSINRFILNNGLTIRIPVHLHEDIRKYRKAQSILRADQNKVPSLQALANELYWEYEKLLFISQVANTQAISVGGYGEGESALEDHFFVDSNSLYQSIESDNLRQFVTNEIRKLDARASDIVCRRFGLNSNDEEETLESIGKRYNLTRERVRQIEAKSLGKILIRLQAKGISKEIIHD